MSIHVRASDWGGDPYSTFHLDARKAKRYDFNADYRDIAYFSFSPSFADPLLANGIVLNQQSFDTHRRLGSFTLDLLPGNWFIPYVGYESDTGSGNGVTTFVSNGNSYPVPNQLNDQTRPLSRRRPFRVAALPCHARGGRHYVQRRPELVSKSIHEPWFNQLRRCAYAGDRANS